MSFDTKEDLQKVCESVIGYQKGLEEIEKYIGRLNQYMTKLKENIEQEKAAEAFREYGDQIEELQTQTTRIGELFREIQDGQNGLVEQFKVLGRFRYAVRNFEDSMKEFNQRADSLTQKLYNKDFANAVKAMNAIAEETKQSATYEYRHVTDHDYEILMHEYDISLKACRQKNAVQQLLAGVQKALCETQLKRGEHESLQRLIEKMVHSDSKALKRFLEEVQGKKGQ